LEAGTVLRIDENRELLFANLYRIHESGHSLSDVSEEAAEQFSLQHTGEV
jgi:hypothetical protein